MYAIWLHFLARGSEVSQFPAQTTIAENGDRPIAGKEDQVRWAAGLAVAGPKTRRRNLTAWKAAQEPAPQALRSDWM